MEGSIRELEQKWSVTSPSSEIYAVNQSGGNPTSISEDTARLLRFALDMAQDTGGALDPTIYPVLTAWGFTTDSYQSLPGKNWTPCSPMWTIKAFSLQATR